MNNILILILVYISYLLIWSAVNFLGFIISIIFKKPQVMKVISGISQVVIYILDLIIGIGLIIYIISLLLSGQILLFIIMILVGVGIVSGLISFLQLPFSFIPTFFETKIESMENEPDYERAEILDKDNKVIEVIEPEKKLNRQLAIYFGVIYALQLFGLLRNLNEYPYSTYKFGDYLVMPFVWTFTLILFFAILIGIFYLFKHRKFFYPRKKVFLIKTEKLAAIIWSIVTGIVFLLSL